MAIRKKLLAGTALLAASLAVAPAASAAELWSVDLWGEQLGLEENSSDWDWWMKDSPADGNTGGGSGGGLWSENLWADDVKGDPAQQNPGGTPAPGQAPTNPGVPGPAPANPGLPGTPPAGPAPQRPAPEAPQAPTAPVTPPTRPEAPPQRPTVPPTPTDAADAIVMTIGSDKATVRGAETTLSVPPFTINGRAMIPLRFIGEALDANVQWSEPEQKVTIERGGKKAELWVNRSSAQLDGQPVELGFPPMVLNGTTLVPLRFVGEFFGFQVNFDAATQTVTIVAPSGSPAAPAPTEPVRPVPPAPERPAAPERPTPQEPAPPQEPEPTPPPQEPAPPQEPEPTPPPQEPVPLPDGVTYDYFGKWELRAEGREDGLLMGGLVVQTDGTYGILVAGQNVVSGTWRPAVKDEIIGQPRGLILENGPNGDDWALIPKQDGVISVRYHYGGTDGAKIWFEYSIGVRAVN